MDQTLEIDGNSVVAVSGKGCEGKIIAKTPFTMVIKWSRAPLGIVDTMTVFHLKRVNKNMDPLYEPLISWGQKKLKRRVYGDR